MAIKQIALVGDSLTAGTEYDAGFSIAQGGLGAWWELMTDRLANISGVGPVVSAGYRGVWLVLGSDGDGEWLYSGTWASVASTDAFDHAPYGSSKYSASGSAAIAKWTKPATWRPVVGFAIYYVDLHRTSGIEGGNWQYRIDGGAWHYMNQTLAHDNQEAKFYVGTTVNSTVEIRAFGSTTSPATGVDTAVAVLPLAIEPFYIDPTAPNISGLIIHNLCENGRSLDEMVVANAGDHMTFFDSVKIDPVNGGGAISNRPNAGISMMHANDIRLFNDTTKWANDLTTFYNRVSPICSVFFMTSYELAQYPDEPGSVSPGYPWAAQASYRAQTKTTAASLGSGVPVFDLYDQWTALGIGTGVGTQNLAARTVGFLNPADNGHQTQAGHLELATRNYWWFRTMIITDVAPSTNSFKVGLSGIGGSDELVGATALINNSVGAVPIAGVSVA